jgi:hypothetical protein
MKLEQIDGKKLSPLLAELTTAIEDLLLTGLTTASDATRNTLNVSFQEASRLGLLRLGGTLRVACEELSRYTRNQQEFSRKRFSFFLNRAWLLSQGLAKAIRDGNGEAFERLSWTPPSTPLPTVQVVTLGVIKKVVPAAFCAYEFRLRAVGASKNADLPDGQRLIWSTIFPIKADSEIPPEGYLHLPQKQKFNAFHFLEGKTVTIENAAVSYENPSVGRISLNDQSIVFQGKEFNEWSRFASWDAAGALARIKAYEPGPLDLDIELQEEVFLEKAEIGEPESDDTQDFYPIRSKGLSFYAVVSKGDDGKALTDSLERFRKDKQTPSLFGLMHYERRRLIVQILSAMGEDTKENRPQYLTLSREKIDRSALLKALKF